MKVLILTVVSTPLLLSVFPLGQIFDGFSAASVKGQRVLICGASSGIGEQMAYEYAKMGAHLALIARREALLEKVVARARELGAASASFITADMGDHSSIVNAVEATLQLPAFDGRLDVLVLNHAVQRWGWLLPDAAAVRAERIGSVGAPWDFAFIDQSVSVNFVSFAKLGVLAMPALVRGADSRKADRGAASQIIVVSSGAGKVAVPKQAVYCGAKHAMLGFFDSLRLEIEHKRLPVTVTNAIVGQVETEMAVGLISADISMPMATVEATALDLIRGGAAGVEELYTPLNQALHVVAVLRPFKILRHLIDRLTLFMMGGRNVYFS